MTNFEFRNGFIKEMNDEIKAAIRRSKREQWDRVYDKCAKALSDKGYRVEAVPAEEKRQRLAAIVKFKNPSAQELIDSKRGADLWVGPENTFLAIGVTNEVAFRVAVCLYTKQKLAASLFDLDAVEDGADFFTKESLLLAEYKQVAADLADRHRNPEDVFASIQALDCHVTYLSLDGSRKEFSGENFVREMENLLGQA